MLILRDQSEALEIIFGIQKVQKKLAKLWNVAPVLWLEDRAGIAKRITHNF